MRHSFLHTDTKNRFPCSRPWRLPCAGTKGAFAVPPGLKRLRDRRKSSAAPIFSAGSCAVGRKLPARPAPEGSVSPVGCCAKRKATRRCAERKRQPCGLLPPKVAKRPEGVSKYKGCARPARRTPIFARERNERRARPASSAKIERPGKAGRYEFTLEDLRVLQTSPNGLFDSLSAPRKRRGARRDAAYSALGPAATTSALMWVYFLKFSTKLLASSLALAS